MDGLAAISRMIDGCHQCPWCSAGDEDMWCNFNQGVGRGKSRVIDEHFVNAGSSPKWCKLRVQPVLIRLRKETI